MNDFNFKTNVVLPEWVFNQAKDTEHLKQLVLQYMKKYPEYKVKAVKNGMAVCIKE